MINKLTSLKSKTTLLDVAVFAILLLALVPYFILCFYTNPSIDDYGFVQKVKEYGLWGAQQNWRESWTGRYASMFILSLHPLLIKSLFLYKLIAFLMLSFTVVCIYRFVKFFSPNKLLQPFIISFVVCFYYLNLMPTILQGIYWEPGSITYQLGNILTLLLATNLLKNLQGNNAFSWLNYLMLIITIGLSETSMIVIDCVVFGFFIFQFTQSKKIINKFLPLIITAVVFSIIVITAPGNKHRSGDLPPFTIDRLFEQLTTVFQYTNNFLVKYILSVQTLFFSVCVLIFSFTVVR